MSLKLTINGQLGSFSLQVATELPVAGITAMFGPSGSGKTTLLRTLAGLQRFTQAHIHWGTEVWQDQHRFVPPQQRAVGYVFQESSLFQHLNVAQNLAFAAQRSAGRQPLASQEEMAHWLGITPLLGRQVNDLSGGERKRVALARAMANAPRLLLLDEPFSGLDGPRKQGIMTMLQELKKQLDIPVILVSHDLREVAQLADHVVVLDSGRIASHGPVAEQLGTRPLLQAQDTDPISLLQTTVLEHHTDWALTQLLLGETDLWAPLRANIEPGQPLRLGISANDVSIARTQPTDSSILNIIPVNIYKVTNDTEGHRLVQLEHGTQRFTARITGRSWEKLDLQVGQAVFAQIKSLAVFN